MHLDVDAALGTSRKRTDRMIRFMRGLISRAIPLKKQGRVEMSWIVMLLV